MRKGIYGKNYQRLWFRTKLRFQAIPFPFIMMKISENPMLILNCVTVNKAGNDSGDFRFHFIDPVKQMACMMVYGDFSNIAGAYLSFADWLENNSEYIMLGPNRQIVHRGPWNEKKFTGIFNRNSNSNTTK